MSNPTVEISVQYVGKDDFHLSAHGDPTFEAVKRKAMHDFELEQSAADKYVLQYQGADLDDKKHISSLDVATVVLILTLKEEPTKG